MAADLSAARWLLRYDVRLRERTVAALVLAPTEPEILLGRRKRTTIFAAEMDPSTDVNAARVDSAGAPSVFGPPGAATDIDDVRVFVFHRPEEPVNGTQPPYPPPARSRVALEPQARDARWREMTDATDVDDVRVFLESFPPPRIAEAEWTPIDPAVESRSPAAEIVLVRTAPEDVWVTTPTSVSDLLFGGTGTIAASRPPPVRYLLSLTPPPLPQRPLLLEPPTPIEPPVVAAPAPAELAPIAGPAVIVPAPATALAPRSQIHELPNPWASAPVEEEDDEESPDVDAPRGPSAARRWLAFGLRSAVLVVVSLAVGVGVRNARAKLRPHVAAAPAPTTTAAPVADVPPKPTEGDLEIHAPAGTAVLVDGKARGEGPVVALKIAPGYHAVRVGAVTTRLVEVHRGSLTNVDLSK